METKNFEEALDRLLDNPPADLQIKDVPIDNYGYIYFKVTPTHELCLEYEGALENEKAKRAFMAVNHSNYYYTGTEIFLSKDVEQRIFKLVKDFGL